MNLSINFEDEFSRLIFQLFWDNNLVLSVGWPFGFVREQFQQVVCDDNLLLYDWCIKLTHGKHGTPTSFPFANWIDSVSCRCRLFEGQ